MGEDEDLYFPLQRGLHKYLKIGTVAVSNIVDFSVPVAVCHCGKLLNYSRPTQSLKYRERRMIVLSLSYQFLFLGCFEIFVERRETTLRKSCIHKKVIMKTPEEKWSIILTRKSRPRYSRHDTADKR